MNLPILWTARQHTVFMDTFGKLNSELGVTIIIVTHDSKVFQIV